MEKPAKNLSGTCRELLDTLSVLDPDHAVRGYFAFDKVGVLLAYISSLGILGPITAFFMLIFMLVVSWPFSVMDWLEPGWIVGGVLSIVIVGGLLVRRSWEEWRVKRLEIFGRPRDHCATDAILQVLSRCVPLAEPHGIAELRALCLDDDPWSWSLAFPLVEGGTVFIDVEGSDKYRDLRAHHVSIGAFEHQWRRDDPSGLWCDDHAEDIDDIATAMAERVRLWLSPPSLLDDKASKRVHIEVDASMSSSPGPIEGRIRVLLRGQGEGAVAMPARRFWVWQWMKASLPLGITAACLLGGLIAVLALIHFFFTNGRSVEEAGFLLLSAIAALFWMLFLGVFTLGRLPLRQARMPRVLKRAVDVLLFDGESLEKGPVRLDLGRPFAVELIRSGEGEGGAMLGVVLRQKRADAKSGSPDVSQIGFVVPAKHSGALESLPRLDMDEGVVGAEDFARTLWPALRHCAQANGGQVGWKVSVEEA